MIVLGLDLGTKCGYALTDEIAGTWNLTPAKHEDGGMRLLKFRKSLTEIIQTGKVELVAYELIIAGIAKGQAAVVFGELSGVLKTTCKDLGVPYVGIPIPSIKKLATGKGNAGKPAMVEAARKRWPAFNGSEDEADARFVRLYAIEQYLWQQERDRPSFGDYLE